MQHSAKGALLSGLVFPGTGQIALKRYKRGIALMLTTSVCLAYIIMYAVEQAFSILNRMDVNGGAIDMGAITNAAAQASGSSGGMLVNVALLVIIVCWIFGIVDAYTIGKEMDNKMDLTS